MTDRPYTDDDLRAEAARQHSLSLEDADFMGISERMQGAEIESLLPPEEADGAEGMHWDDLPPEDFDAAQRSIDGLLTSAADVSAWAVAMGADGLEPSEDTLSLKGDDQTIVRVHFAFAPGMPAEVRESFVTGVSGAIATRL